MKRQNLDRKFIFTLLCGTCKTFQKDREMKILQLLFTLIPIKNLVIVGARTNKVGLQSWRLFDFYCHFSIKYVED